MASHFGFAKLEMSEFGLSKLETTDSEALFFTLNCILGKLNFSHAIYLANPGNLPQIFSNDQNPK